MELPDPELGFYHQALILIHNYVRTFTSPVFTGVPLLNLSVGLSNCGSSSDSAEPASLAGNYQIAADKISPAIDFFGI